MRWGMIGCGSVAEKKSAPAYQLQSGFKLAGVYSRNRVKAQDYANRHAVSMVYDSAQALISDPAIDAVYIATPPDSHCDYALQVAAAGKPCCVEKPMGVNYQQSLRMQHAFQAANQPLFVAYYRRSLPRFLKVREWLQQNQIGEVRQVNWRLQKPANAMDLAATPKWRTEAEVARGGYFEDIGSHGLNLITYLLGDIHQLTGYAVNQLGLYSAADSLAASWLHESGVIGSGSWSFGSDRRQDRLEIWGSDGVISCSVFDEIEIVLDSKAGKESLLIENPDPIQRFHVANIASHLAGDVMHLSGASEHPSLADSAVHTRWLMEQLLADWAG